MSNRASRFLLLFLISPFGLAAADPPETLAKLNARLSEESLAAYHASPFAEVSRDVFARYSRDADARLATNEISLVAGCSLVLPDSPSACTTKMREYFEDFLVRRMQVSSLTLAKDSGSAGQRIVLCESGGGVADVPESFTIEITRKEVLVQGRDVAGLRDGIVQLVDTMGFRQAPFLPLGKQVFKPRIPVRLGSVPYLGSYREAVFLGYNAVFVPGGSLFAVSTSEALPEVKDRRDPRLLDQLREGVKQAAAHGLRTFCWLDTRQKFPKDHPVFQAHPAVRGTLTWKADGEYVLCTSHSLVKQFLSESVEGMFRASPQLNGVVVIVGGEGFYHCFMRSFGVEKGRSACVRCDALGADRVVADLCDTLAVAARRHNPSAEVIAWPYSAEHVWSADKYQSGMIRLFKPGTGLLTEVEKDEYVDKPEGFKKHLWDYSIDLIGPGERARKQIQLCRSLGIPIYIKTESELAFEAPRLPFVPCHDRWLDRALSIAASGASGAWMFPAFKPFYGSTVGEVAKFAAWNPSLPPEVALDKLAARTAGPESRTPPASGVEACFGCDTLLTRTPVVLHRTLLPRPRATDVC